MHEQNGRRLIEVPKTRRVVGRFPGKRVNWPPLEALPSPLRDIFAGPFDERKRPLPAAGPRSCPVAGRAGFDQLFTKAAGPLDAIGTLRYGHCRVQVHLLPPVLEANANTVQRNYRAWAASLNVRSVSTTKYGESVQATGNAIADFHLECLVRKDRG